jgi:YVTN family beta-propeller protein
MTVMKMAVGTFPSDIALNDKTNMLYVPNEHSDTVSVIDGRSNNLVDKIQVGNFPTRVEVNPSTNTIYVINEDSDTVSIIDGNTRDILVGVNFKINPINAGHLICNGKKIVNDTYVRYINGATLECKAVPNKDFTTGIWSGNIVPTSTSISSDSVAMKLDRFGNLNGNFAESQSVDLNIPFDTLVQILLIIVAAVATWSIPGIVGYMSKLRQKGTMVSYMNSINGAKRKGVLEELLKEISDEHARGKLSLTNYETLNKRIKEKDEELQHSNETSSIN